MPRKQVLDLVFPVGGLDERYSFQKQRPFTTPDCLNVRPYDTQEGRERGGSRPGLGRAFYDQLGSGNPVRLLNSVAIVENDGLQSWTDTFRGTVMGAAWQVATWSGAGGLPAITDQNFVSVSFSGSAAAVRVPLANFDSSQAYTVELFIVPYLGAHHGKYQIFVRMNDSSPNALADSYYFEFQITGTTGVYSGSVKRYSGGSLASTTAFSSGTFGYAEAGWFIVTVSGTTVTASFAGTTLLGSTVLAAPSAGGARIGFGMEATVAGGICITDAFRVQYRTNNNTQANRRIVVASANGSFYREGFLSRLDQVSTAFTLASDRELRAAERGQKLYIADNGNPAKTGTDGVRGSGNDRFDAASVADWTTLGANVNDFVLVLSNVTGNLIAGTYELSAIAAGEITLTTSIATGAGGIASWRLERGPKIYDPIANTISRWVATAGQVPTGAPLIALWNDRLVLAGAPVAPHVWYMSRQGAPLDFDFAASTSDSQRAVAGTSTDQAQVGEPINALVSHSDDYLIFGCDTSLWIIRGNPALTGSMDNLSRVVGIVDKTAWCHGPLGELVFLSRDGLYQCTSGASYPVSISRERLPRELRDFDKSQYTILMAYDPQDEGVHIYLTATHFKSQLHWWFDWETKGFWPLQMQSSNHEPTSIYEHVSYAPENSAVLLGCRDGYVRRFRDTHETDDGSTFNSYVSYGPIRLGGDDFHEGVLTQIFGATDLDSGDVDWSVKVADTSEGAFKANALYSGEWNTPGLNNKARVRARGHSALVRITGGEARAWSMERLGMIRKSAGKQRL